MLRLSQLVLTQPDPSKIHVEWCLESSSEAFSDYRLSLFKGQLPSSAITDYECVASGINPHTTSEYDDTSISGINSKFVDYYYCTQISGIQTHTVYTSAPVSISVQPDAIAREIVRRRNIIMRLHSGTQAYILKQKEYGTFCNVCFDPILQKITDAQCTTCWGTGYVGGYYKFGPINVQINEQAIRNQLTPFGEFHDGDAIAMLPNTPAIKPRDILVDRLGRRWNIINVRSNNKSLFTIGQQAQCRLFEKSDIIYRIPV